MFLMCVVMLGRSHVCMCVVKLGRSHVCNFCLQLICSNRGACECNECICNDAIFTGQFCQFCTGDGAVS